MVKPTASPPGQVVKNGNKKAIKKFSTLHAGGECAARGTANTANALGAGAV